MMRLHADAGCLGGVMVDGYRFPQALCATNWWSIPGNLEQFFDVEGKAPHVDGSLCALWKTHPARGCVSWIHP